MKWLLALPILLAGLWLGRFWLALRLGRLCYRLADRRRQLLFARRWARQLYRYAAR